MEMKGDKVVLAQKKRGSAAGLTSLQGSGPSGVAWRAVPSRVEGRQSDQVRGVRGQVGQEHTRVWDEDHLDLLRLVLPVPLPVVDLQRRDESGHVRWTRS